MPVQKETPIRTRPVPTCRVCGTQGTVVYEGFQDRVFRVPGTWNQRKCPATDCGLVWLDPVPIEEDIGKVYESYYTHNQPTPLAGMVSNLCWAVWKSYLRHRFGYQRGTGPGWTSILWPLALLHPGGRAELDSAAMYLRVPNRPARLLDVGCGSGVMLARMKSFGWDAEGQEIDPAAAESARTRGVRVQTGTLHEQKYPNDHFDAVHMAHVIEHVHDPDELLRECFRILKPGGKLVVLTPNVDGFGHRKFGRLWSNLDPPRHLVLFNRKTLRAVAVRSGFVADEVRTTPRTAWVYGAMSLQLQRTGRIDMASFHKSGRLLYGIAYQLRQRTALSRDRDAGDDLLLLATRSRETGGLSHGDHGFQPAL